MHSFYRRSALLTAALLVSACTQPAAMVDLQGDRFFGRSEALLAPAGGRVTSFSMRAEPTPVYAPGSNTQHTASLQTVGVVELAPIAAVKSEPAAAPQQRAQTLPAASPEVAQSGKPVVLRHASHSAKAEEFMWPVNSRKIVSAYGPKGAGKSNDGINIASAEGEPVWAAADGEVVYVGNELAGYGNMVIIKHADGKNTTYAHLSRAAIDKYDRVQQGDIVGYVGATGNIGSPQLHFAIREGKEPVDPKRFLSTSMAGL